MALPLNWAVRINSDTSVKSTPTPIRPFASSSQSKAERSSQAEANILIAAANITICVAPFTIVPPPLLITLAAATIIADRLATPMRPVVSCLESKSPIFFKAPARISTAVAMPSIAVTLLTTPVTSPLILLNIAIEAIKSAKSTVIAPREAFSFLLSIRLIATMDAVRIAIADAILRSVPACSCF